MERLTSALQAQEKNLNERVDSVLFAATFAEVIRDTVVTDIGADVNLVERIFLGAFKRQEPKSKLIS